MKNYKIKVNDEAESKEAQELFFELGYIWNIGSGVKHLDVKFLYARNGIITVGLCSGNFENSENKEITLPQLRDLVVLHRNDPNDANVQQDGDIPCLYDLYLTGSKELYFYHCEKMEWILSNLNGDEDYYKVLKPINKDTEQGLISGADALRALADGEDVEYFSNADYTWKSIFKYHPSLEIIANKELDINHKFRLKPRTITLNIEIPAPFEPKVGDKCYRIAPILACGYTEFYFDNDSEDQFGAWDSEEKIKAVVAALRGIKG